MCGFGGRTCVFGLALTALPRGVTMRTADAVSMKAEESAAVAQRIAEEFGMTVAREVRKGGAHIRLASGVNIHRNPLCGRNFECFSEDPLSPGKLRGHSLKIRCVRPCCSERKQI